MKKVYLIIILIVIVIGVVLLLPKNNNEIDDKEILEMEEIFIEINDNLLTVKLEDNSSSRAFLERLKNGNITIHARDYGNFEKVGKLGFSLPTNDKRITTEPGDLILYQGDKITLYYDTNTWTFTKLGKVIDINSDELKRILGSHDVEMTFKRRMKDEK